MTDDPMGPHGRASQLEARRCNPHSQLEHLGRDYDRLKSLRPTQYKIAELVKLAKEVVDTFGVDCKLWQMALIEAVDTVNFLEDGDPMQ